MKNTKNLLLSGVALVITLFASVEVVAMEGVNTKLTPSQVKWLKWEINRSEQRLESCDPKKNPSPKMIEVCNEHRKLLANIKPIYYGNRTYTDDEIQAKFDE